MCLPCQALPRRALPSLAPPRKLQRPRGAAVCLPCQAMPRLAAPLPIIRCCSVQYATGEYEVLDLDEVINDGHCSLLA